MRQLKILAMFGVCLSLTSCGKPTLKADSVADFNASYAAMQSALTGADSQKLDDALRDITLIESDAYGPEADAQSELQAAQSYQPSDDIMSAGGLGNGLLGNMMQLGWDANKGQAVMNYSAKLVDGKNAAEIEGIAQQERQKANTVVTQDLQKAISIYQGFEGQAADKAAKDAAILKGIQISNASFSYSRDVFGNQSPVMSFDIKNNSGVAIQEVDAIATVRTPGRSVPWFVKQMSYQFPGGLESGEQQHLALQPQLGAFDWPQIPAAALSSVVAVYQVAAVQDAGGNTIGTVPSDDDLTAIGLGAMQQDSPVTQLQNKINELQQKIVSLND